jgi:integrative and conjugative element protein (TIGR02256 family)
VGRGCGDISLVLSYELILLHAATLARQVRLLRDQEKPVIRVWITDPEMGSKDVKNVDVFKSKLHRIESCGWTVIWDESIDDKLYTLRHRTLPNETGGIILGFMDQKIRKIYVVDFLDAPPDSISSPDSFIRGKEGLNEILAEVSRRTDGIVGYIGEWHSHPHISALPSEQDMGLINELAETLSTDGLPALMAVVAKDDIRFELKGGHNE